MPDGIYAALSGAIAQEQALDVISNNVANINTTGFKQDRISFREVQASLPENRSTEDRQTVVDAVLPDMSGGPLRVTGNALDVAATGDGFFAIATPAGERYTRAGNFTIDSNGRLATHDGNLVLGQGGPIEIGTGADAKHVNIDDEGNVIRDGAQVDRLRMVRFDNPAALVREGGSNWNASTQVPNEVDANVASGTLEHSNVSAVHGMTQLIQVSRAYETFGRAIEMFRELDQKTTQDLGK
jgi:flagellar basal-body rod protein FlgF